MPMKKKMTKFCTIFLFNDKLKKIKTACYARQTESLLIYGSIMVCKKISVVQQELVVLEFLIGLKQPTAGGYQ